MTISISQFRNRMRLEPASSNRFLMEFIQTPPALSAKYGPLFEEGLRFQTMVSEVPGKQLQTADYTSYGPSRKFVLGSVYSPMTIGVILSDDWKEKKFFDDWHSLIVDDGTSNIEGSHDIEYYDNYISTVRISTYDRTYNQTSTYELYECYPTTVSPTPLNWDEQNTFVVLNVEIAYRQWRRIV